MHTTPQMISRMAGKLLAVAFFGAALSIPQAPADAFGGGGGGGGGGGNPTCGWDEVWDNKKKKCVPARGDMTPDQRYEYGWKLAKTGNYAKAIEVLMTADQSDPRVLNYLGYSHRKSGDLETGIKYYKAALAIDPDFVLAREYLGEGYVKAGRLDLAKLELEQIARRCGKGCKEYIELAAVIDGSDTATW